MSFNVQFGTVYKRHNSTFRGASGSHWLTLAVTLKEDCSVLRPSFFVDVAGTQIFGNGGGATLNHCYVALFDRYYFIDNWTFERGHWRADCSIDVLATWRNTIGSSSQYVLRSASAKDGTIFDAMYPVKNAISYDTMTDSTPWDIYNGYYVVGIISGGGSGLGSVGYYAFTATQFKALMVYLFDDVGQYINLSNVAQDMSRDTFKALFNPFQYIVSCMYMPFDMSGQMTTLSNIDVGYWAIPVQGGRLNSLSPRNISISLPWTGTHPNANRGNYVYCSPYTDVDLDIPPFGHFKLPSDIVYDRGGVDLTIKVDWITGRGICYIGGLIAPYMTVESQVGVPIQISQMSTDWMGAVSTAAQGVGNTISAIMSGDIGGAIGAGVACIDSSIRAQVPTLATMGSNGGLGQLVQPPTAIYTYHEIVDDDITRNGAPLCQERTISTLSGYILCINASVETSGTYEENQQISNLMNTGFYYE